MKILVLSRDMIVALDLKFLCKSIGHTDVKIEHNDFSTVTINKHKPDLAIINMSESGRAELEKYVFDVSQNCSTPAIFLSTLPENRRKKIILNDRSIFCSLPYSDDDIINGIKKFANLMNPPLR